MYILQETITQCKQRGRLFKALERIVKSSNVSMQKKFAKFLYAVSQADHEHVSEQLKEVFNDAGLNHLVTGQFPKVRMKVHI